MYQYINKFCVSFVMIWAYEGVQHLCKCNGKLGSF